MQDDDNVQNDTTRPTMYVPEMRALQIVESIKTYQKGKRNKRTVDNIEATFAEQV